MKARNILDSTERARGKEFAQGKRTEDARIERIYDEDQLILSISIDANDKDSTFEWSINSRFPGERTVHKVQSGKGVYGDIIATVELAENALKTIAKKSNIKF